MFYEADASRLEAEVRGFLAASEQATIDFDLRILIVPHAGHVYSGPVAATGYRLLQGSQQWRRIVLVGPSHFVPFSGLALPGVDYLDTPLGAVPVDSDGVSVVRSDPLVVDNQEAHRREHSLEVQLPFLRLLVPDVPVVPLLTGAVDPQDVSAALEPLLDDGTLLLISSDLSHYHDAATARRLDSRTAMAISEVRPEDLDWDSACGRTGVQAALFVARRRQYRVRILDLRNSADTAGPPDRVVGYGTFALG
jgi:AmmeMemoRadiSam system protein B